MKVAVFVALLSLAFSQTTGPGVPDERCPPGFPSPPIHFPDEADDKKYFTCIDGLMTPSECPEGEKMNEEFLKFILNFLGKFWNVDKNNCDSDE